MTPAARKARQRQREAAQRERLLYMSDEWRAFVDIGGLQRKAGSSWAFMPATVRRELADNAADAADGAGAWIEIVAIDGTEWWCVGDHGAGIAPDQVARVFSVNRPMQSTKHVRWPTGGMLGNGTRVVAGYCAIEGHRIMMDARAVRTVLRVNKVTGETVTERQAPIAPEAT